MAAALRPLLIDIGIPVGSYYLLHDGFGLSLWLSLALSSIGPAVRATAGLVAKRELNLLAVLILVVSLAGIAVSFLSGDPRAMIAKDSIVSSVIAFAILGSAALRRPLMSAGLKPFMTRGEPRRTAAWDRLSTASPRFRRLEMLFSTIWGMVLLAECAARLVGAYTLPVTTMVWLGTVLALGAIGVAMIAGGAAAGPIQKMIDAEAAAS
jgi:formate-dependent nitrite reductase membrane component NrfD